MTAPTTPRRATPTGVLILTAEQCRDRGRWLAERRKGIGSSDVAAILGVSDWATAAHVYHDKLGHTQDNAGEAALWGTLLEDTVAQEWCRRNRSVISRAGLIAHQEHGWMRATLDRRVHECPLDRRKNVCALEVKCRSAFKANRWHRDTPDDVLAQTTWQMAVTGYDHIHVAVLIGGNDFRQTVVRREQTLEAYAVDKAGQMWHVHIGQGVEPDWDFGKPAAALELSKMLHPDRAGVDTLDIDGLEAVREYADLSARHGEIGRQLKAARARLTHLAGGHVAMTWSDELAYEFRPVTKSSCDLAALAERWPDAYADCVSEKTHDQIAIAAVYRNGATE